MRSGRLMGFWLAFEDCSSEACMSKGIRRRWPHGKYNGRRIKGFSVSFELDLLWRQWIPRFQWNFGMPMLRWLCVVVRAEAEYEWTANQAGGSA